MLFGNIADGPQGVNDPKTLADVGNGFPMRQGYTIVWSGWDPDAPRANMGLGLTAPVATDNGKPIVEDGARGVRLGHARRQPRSLQALLRSGLAGPAEGAADGARARQRRAAANCRCNQWSFVDARSIKLSDGTSRSRAGSTSSTTRRRIPRCRAGLRGNPRRRELAAPRPGGDRGHRRQDQPCARHRLLPGGALPAQPHLRGLQSRRAGPPACSTASIAHIAGIGRIFFNTPFGQPARTGTQHEDHDFPENAFPFSTAALADPLTGRKGSLFRGDGSAIPS